MALYKYSQILPCLFALAIGTIIFISWAEFSDSLRWTAISPRSLQLWEVLSRISPTPMTTTTTEPPGLTPIPILHRKDYKKLPQWDFEDEYRQDRTPRRTCKNSLWNIVNTKSNETFKSKFIQNIRKYVHNGSITMREWNRLSHFNNPFGFMDYKYEDVMAAINLVPKPKYPLLEPLPGRDGCISCAVVANGGVLWKSKKGKEIDAHDYVFRVNGAVIKGYEEDVGNRTSVYVHTAHSITSSEWMWKKFNYTRAPHDDGIKYVLIPEGMRDFQWMIGLYKGERLTFGDYKGRRPRVQYSDQFNETRFYVLHQDFLRYVRNRFLKSSTLNEGYWAIVRPTNGAFMLVLALHVCDRVSAYGFMTENYKQYANYYYEKGAKTHVVFYANHNYLLEMEVWKKLHDLNIINLYQGEPSQTEAPKTL